MDRPKTVSPLIWDRLDAKAKEFLVFHEEMHGKMQAILGVSRTDYYVMCRELMDKEGM